MTAASPQAKVLLIGINPAAESCLGRLIADGVRNLCVLSEAVFTQREVALNPWLSPSEGEPVAEKIGRWISTEHPQVHVEVRNQDPLTVITSTPAFALSFDLAITMDAPRPVEEALGELFYEAPPKALIISRNEGFNVKMRSQYRLHKVTDEPGNIEIEGRSLHPRPEPPTEEKCARVRAALESAVDATSPKMLAYLLTIWATGDVFKSVQGYPPAHRPGDVILTGHEAEVKKRADQVVAEKGLQGVSADEGRIKLCCAGGFSALPFTSYVLGSMMAVEGIKLLTQTGRPINNTGVDLAAAALLGIPCQI